LRAGKQIVGPTARAIVLAVAFDQEATFALEIVLEVSAFPRSGGKYLEACVALSGASGQVARRCSGLAMFRLARFRTRAVLVWLTVLARVPSRLVQR
jgi:hypothetical protein